MPEHRNPYTKEQITELRRLDNLSRRTNGHDPKDSPRRIAGDQFVEAIMEIRDTYDPPLTWPELFEPLGIAPATGRAKVARRVGGDLLPPSQRGKAYKGEPYNENKRTRTTFSCGHPRTKENSYWNPALGIDVCRIHQGIYSERSKARPPEQRRKINRKATA